MLEYLFLIKFANSRTATLLKKIHWHRCFPMAFVKFLRTPLYRILTPNHLWNLGDIGTFTSKESSGKDWLRQYYFRNSRLKFSTKSVFIKFLQISKEIIHIGVSLLLQLHIVRLWYRCLPVKFAKSFWVPFS